MRSAQNALFVDEIERARTREYELLAVLLAEAPDADLLNQLAQLRGDDTPLGTAHMGLADAAAAANCRDVEREFFELFIGVGRGELLPYASYYLAGALHDRPLAKLRADLARFGIARAESCSEPEDHAAVLCEIMAVLVDRRFNTSPGTDRDLFENHVATWIGRFFADLEGARAADFYRRVARVGRQFIAIESEAFRLAA